MSNYSVLQQNTLAGFSETAGILYLKMIDVFQGNEREAFRVSCDYENRLGSVLEHIFQRYPGFSDLSEETKTALSKFYSERWRHNFMDK